MFVPADTIEMTSQPSADFAERSGARASASYDEAVTEENSCMAVMLDDGCGEWAGLPRSARAPGLIASVTPSPG